MACVINISSLLHKSQDGDSGIIINLSDGDPGTNGHWQSKWKIRNKEEEAKLLRATLRVGVEVVGEEMVIDWERIYGTNKKIFYRGEINVGIPDLISDLFRG